MSLTASPVLEKACLAQKLITFVWLTFDGMQLCYLMRGLQYFSSICILCITTCMVEISPRLWKISLPTCEERVRMSSLKVESEAGRYFWHAGRLYQAGFVNQRQRHISTRQGHSACLARYFKNMCVMRGNSACSVCCSSRGRAKGHEVWFLCSSGWRSFLNRIWMQKVVQPSPFL